MKFVSLFSGVGGFDLGLERAGWECVAQVEWDTQCQAVLARHWPNVPRWGDVSEVNGADLPIADVFAFGSPCQDLSVAGRRAGFSEGSRSSLFFEAIRIIKEMQVATSHAFPRFVIWENVAGALSSSGGRDFGAVLDHMAELGAMDIGWRVLDAQYFGVPQRRRRVFVVADLAGRCAGAIHTQSESVCRADSSSDETRQDSAAAPAGGSNDPSTFCPRRHGEYAQGVGTLRAWGGDVGGGSESIVVEQRVAAPLLARDSRGPTLDGSANGHLVLSVAFNAKQDGADVGSTAPTLLAGGHDSSHANGGVMPAVLSFYPHSSGMQGFGVGTDISPTITVGTGLGIPSPPGVVAQNVPRRLTPIECERLMGWPDDHTALRADGSTVADSTRYKMCGNGVASPVAEWLAHRINDALVDDMG